jgi:hypothetical protein
MRILAIYILILGRFQNILWEYFWIFLSPYFSLETIIYDSISEEILKIVTRNSFYIYDKLLKKKLYKSDFIHKCFYKNKKRNKMIFK